MTGTGATHQIACFNPPTEEEAAAGKPLSPGFVSAPPPAGMIDEVGAGRIGSTADLEGLVADIQAEEGPLSLGPVGRRAADPTRARAPRRTRDLP